MYLRITKTDDGLRLTGELDMASEQALRSALREAVASGEPVNLDFADVSFMDSTGLSVLLAAARTRIGGEPVVVVRPRAAVKRVLTLSIPGGAPGFEIRD